MSINGNNEMETPSQTLASKIAQRLSDEQLLSTEVAQKLSSQLASGTLKAEDWRLALEKAISGKATVTGEGHA